MEIEFQAPRELDFKSKAEVLALRTSAVQRYSELLANAYAPSVAVFGEIADGAPWWGLTSHLLYASGEHSIDGPSEEARFILNPYLLVAADFHGAWGQGLLPDQFLLDPNTTLDCFPTRIHWRPRQAQAEARYPAECVTKMSSRYFDLIAYNARDLNLSFIYVPYEEAQNVRHWSPPPTAYNNPQYLHRGGSCGYPGGCNNMSPSTPDIDGLEITGFPARVVARLWKNQPASVNQPPDMTFVLKFE